MSSTYPTLLKDFETQYLRFIRDVKIGCAVFMSRPTVIQFSKEWSDLTAAEKEGMFGDKEGFALEFSSLKMYIHTQAVLFEDPKHLPIGWVKFWDKRGESDGYDTISVVSN